MGIFAAGFAGLAAVFSAVFATVFVAVLAVVFATVVAGAFTVFAALAGLTGSAAGSASLRLAVQSLVLPSLPM